MPEKNPFHNNSETIGQKNGVETVFTGHYTTFIIPFPDNISQPQDIQLVLDALKQQQVLLTVRPLYSYIIGAVADFSTLESLRDLFSEQNGCSIYFGESEHPADIICFDNNPHLIALPSPQTIAAHRAFENNLEPGIYSLKTSEADHTQTEFTVKNGILKPVQAFSLQSMDTNTPLPDIDLDFSNISIINLPEGTYFLSLDINDSTHIPPEQRADLCNYIYFLWRIIQRSAGGNIYAIVNITDDSIDLIVSIEGLDKIEKALKLSSETNHQSAFSFKTTAVPMDVETYIFPQTDSDNPPVVAYIKNPQQILERTKALQQHHKQSNKNTWDISVWEDNSM